jgi:hypothetical protein
VAKSKVIFDTSIAAYIENGKTIPREVIREKAEYHALKTGAKLKQFTRKALNRKMDAADFEQGFRAILKDSHLVAGMLGRGGKDNTHLVHYGAIGRSLKEQYGYLSKFTDDLVDGKLSMKQALHRAAQYGASSLQSFSTAEMSAIKDAEFTKGRRSLTPGAAHCAECREYVTKGYVDLNLIVPIGVNCSCRGNCRCTIVFRR